uniref:Uncharacterized protein n=1 Tax=Pseudomonas aeruginosa TaxID=287 RepID=A0A5P9WCG9_PSEAI|nr:hypothetical protein pNK546KPC_0320 [Pseudomonas aeruginosa]
MRGLRVLFGFACSSEQPNDSSRQQMCTLMKFIQSFLGPRGPRDTTFEAGS